MTGTKQVSFRGEGVLVNAPAKINLSLLVGALREDGYHEIESVMAKVDWFDEVLVERSEREGIQLICKGPEWAPEGAENLAYQACRKMCDRYDIPSDIQITLDKRIPGGAGLGSASSDAAAVLIGLDSLFQLGLPIRELSVIADQLGADVPFFLGGPMAFCRGRGEKIRKLRKNFNFHALIIVPDVSVSTKRVYEYFQENEAVFKKLSKEINHFIGENRIDLITRMCPNMLNLSCFELYNRLERLKNSIESLDIGPLCLSGSGSSFYKIYYNDDIGLCEKDKHKLKESINCKCVIVSNNRW